jgi:hypothetical protein
LTRPARPAATRSSEVGSCPSSRGRRPRN